MSLLATMLDILITLRSFLKKLKCIIGCCNSKSIIDYNRIDGVDKDDQQRN